LSVGCVVKRFARHMWRSIIVCGNWSVVCSTNAESLTNASIWSAVTWWEPSVA
jgi:hypothetical protein